MVCEACNKEHDGSFGGGRFCSRACCSRFNGGKSSFRCETLLCEKCGRAVTSNNLKRHLERCSGFIRKKRGSAKGLTYEEYYGEEEAARRRKHLSEKSKINTNFSKIEWTPERRKQQSDKKKAFYRDHPEKHPNRLLANNKISMSYPERLIFERLQSLGWKFEHQKRILHFFVDFYLPDYQILLEVDGERWHDKDRDRMREQKILAELPEARFVRLKAKNVLQQFAEVFEATT